MAPVKVLYKNKTYDFDSSEVKSGEDAVKVLSSFIPALAEGQVDNTQVVDGVTTYTLSARAKPKGGDERSKIAKVGEKLEQMRRFNNPAVVMVGKLEKLDIDAAMLLLPEIENARSASILELEAGKHIGDRLAEMEPTPAKNAPAGF